MASRHAAPTDDMKVTLAKIAATIQNRFIGSLLVPLGVRPGTQALSFARIFRLHKRTLSET